MAHYSFRGGIHFQDEKKLSKNCPIKEILPGRELVFPLLQHQGAAAVPAVLLGERVLKGQLLAQADGCLSAAVHSSVSGFVKAIEPRTVADGREILSIVIENDDQYAEVDFGDFVEPDELTGEEILLKIRQAGIIGMGGAGFPTAEKLSVAEPEKIRYVIVNGTESEPYLTSAYRSALEKPEWMVEGLRIAMKLFPNAKGLIAIENNKPEAITAIQKVTADTRNIRLVPVHPKYPQGAERMLIYACTGRKICSAQIPQDVGCVVLSLGTVFNICNAVTFGKPVMKRLITVSGDCVREPQNFQVSLGMSMEEAVNAAGGLTDIPDRLICGGPMTGILMKHLQVPVTKLTAAVLALGSRKELWPAEGECIRCGRCIEVCNEHLLPGELADYAKEDRRDKFLSLGGMECCACGSCTYICPAKRPLTYYINKEKNQILNQ